MGDFLYSGGSIQEAETLKHNLITLLKRGNFSLTQTAIECERTMREKW